MRDKILKLKRKKEINPKKLIDIDKKENFKNKSKNNSLNGYKFGLKFFLVFFLIMTTLYYNFFYENNYFDNSLDLLAVSGPNEDIGSLVKLNIDLKNGNGNIVTKLDSLKGYDTQFSMLESKYVACDLFNLNCEDYDYYFDFRGGSKILKGPSAGSGFSILLVNSILKKDFPDDVVITGTINPGGLIGYVGGIDAKIKVAQKENKSKIIIPYVSNISVSDYPNIEVIKAFDIFEVYEIVNNEKFEKEKKELDLTSYNFAMKNLAYKLCENANLKNKILETLNISKNSTHLIQFNSSYSNAMKSLENEKYYSAGSFCFNANINGEYLILNNTIGDDKFKSVYKDFEQEYLEYFLKYNGDDFQKKIKTYNDLYVYFTILDRIEETKDLFNQIDLDNENKTSQNYYNLAYAKERFETAKLWEEMILNEGREVNLEYSKLKDGCNLLVQEISLKNEYLSKYGFDNSEQVNKVASSHNAYLCLYKGLELSGTLDTFLNLLGVREENLKEYNGKVLDLTIERIKEVSNKNGFPLLSYIYYEYATELENSNLQSSFLYSNYALSFNNIDKYLEFNNQRELTKTQQFDYSYYFIFFIILGALLLI